MHLEYRRHPRGPPPWQNAFQGQLDDLHSKVDSPPTASSSRFKEAIGEKIQNSADPARSHPIPSSEHGISLMVSGSVNHRKSPSEDTTNHKAWHAVTIKMVGAFQRASCFGTISGFIPEARMGFESLVGCTNNILFAQGPLYVL